jgi:hypothetical protein
MDDPQQFGRELADTLATRVQAGEISAEEAARVFTQTMLSQANQMVGQNTSRKDAEAWLEAAAFAYGAHLEESRAFFNKSRAYES